MLLAAVVALSLLLSTVTSLTCSFEREVTHWLNSERVEWTTRSMMCRSDLDSARHQEVCCSSWQHLLISQLYYCIYFRPQYLQKNAYLLF